MSQIGQVIPFKPSKVISFWAPLTFVVAVGGLLIVMIFALLAYQIAYLNRVYPGVVVMGIDAGGMTEPELSAAIAARAPDYLKRSVTVTAGEQSWTFSGQELGLHINAKIIAGKVYAVGREGDLFTDMSTHFELLQNPYVVDPLLWYDTGPTNLVLQQLAQEINVSPRDAQLIIQPDGRVEAIPAQRGRQLHVDATRAEIEASLFGGKGERVEAVVQEILPAIPEIEPARRQAENLLNAPIVFRAQVAETGEPLLAQLDQPTVAGMVEVVHRVDETGKTQIGLELDPQKFTPYFEQLAQAIYRQPVDAKLDFNEETSEVTVMEESQNGYELDLAAAYARVPALLENPANVIDLPLRVTPATISSENLAELGIEALVSESTSYFKGSSEGRMKNIDLAAARFDNVVVPPGGIFSFNDHLGEVTKENGFDESLIIFGNRTAVGIGGGVCQVSTTVFRAAFFGGFEIVERWAHGYRVGWYETNSGPGLDATIYSPDVDFRFRNDTEHYLLIKTETDLAAGTLTFRFYGTPTNREVIVGEAKETNRVKPQPPLYEEDPSLPKGVVEQVDWANDGLDVSITRTVKVGETVIHEDNFISRYRPWRAIFKVGTGGSPTPASFN